MASPSPSAHTAKLNYLKVGKPDAATLLAPPPLAGSAEQAADLDEVRAVYHAASSNDIAAAYSEKTFSVFNYTSAVGTFFQSNNLPKTVAFFEKVQRDAETVTDLRYEEGRLHFKVKGDNINITSSGKGNDKDGALFAEDDARRFIDAVERAKRRRIAM